MLILDESVWRKAREDQGVRVKHTKLIFGILSESPVLWISGTWTGT